MSQCDSLLVPPPVKKNMAEYSGIFVCLLVCEFGAIGRCFHRPRRGGEGGLRGGVEEGCVDSVEDCFLSASHLWFPKVGFRTS